MPELTWVNAPEPSDPRLSMTVTPPTNARVVIPPETAVEVGDDPKSENT